jgi:hypothetical protein
MLVAALRGGDGRSRARPRVGRPERPLDASDGPVARFALALRQLRGAAGYPSYRMLARTALYSPSVLSSAASGTTFPSLPVTLAYARSCGGDVTEWCDRWAEAAAEIAAADPSAKPGAVTRRADRHTVATSRSSPVELCRPSLRPAK